MRSLLFAILLTAACSVSTRVVLLPSESLPTPPFDTVRVVTQLSDGTLLEPLEFSGSGELPANFVLGFDPARRGEQVAIFIEGLLGEQHQFSALANAIVGQDTDVTIQLCGDGALNQQVADGSLLEACDDGQNSNNDGCNSACQLEFCGDGILQGGVVAEECDDGNLIETDACPSTCEDARCGDGFVQSGIESCDDGNLIETDLCNNDCLRAIEAVVAGGAHTCALLDSGAVRCWGEGSLGQLGYGDTFDIGDNETPASAGDITVGGTVTQLAAGSLHTCALLDSGAVRCWGNGNSGRLGYGNQDTIGDNETPASVGDITVGGTVTQLAAGSSHTCALLNSGAVRCWGFGFFGQLGYGDTFDIGDNETPASAGDITVGGTVTQLAAGSSHTCALLDSGAVRCWGEGSLGQLGYGDTFDIGDNETPASAGDITVGGTVTQLAAGSSHTCALLDSGAVKCWGDTSFGQLGYGNQDTIGDNETPASVGNITVGGTVTQLAAGSLHTCVLLDSGAVRCWGEGNDGRLGYGNQDTIGDNETPAEAYATLPNNGDITVGDTVTQLAAGSSHTCALLNSGAVRCWGNGGAGRLGYGNLSNIGDDPNETPALAGDITVR